MAHIHPPLLWHYYTRWDIIHSVMDSVSMHATKLKQGCIVLYVF